MESLLKPVIMMNVEILPKHSRTLTEKSAPFSDTCLEFMDIFRKIVIISLAEIHQTVSFSMLPTNENIMNLEQLIFLGRGGI